jgi:hypothetical protein
MEGFLKAVWQMSFPYNRLGLGKGMPAAMFHLAVKK